MKHGVAIKILEAHIAIANNPVTTGYTRNDLKEKIVSLKESIKRLKTDKE